MSHFDLYEKFPGAEPATRRQAAPPREFTPQQQAAINRSLQAELNAFLYMIVSIAALVLSVALFSWAIWA